MTTGFAFSRRSRPWHFPSMGMSETGITGASANSFGSLVFHPGARFGSKIATEPAGGAHAGDVIGGNLSDDLGEALADRDPVVLPDSALSMSAAWKRRWRRSTAAPGGGSPESHSTTL